MVLSGTSGLYEHSVDSLPIRPDAKFVREHMARGTLKTLVWLPGAGEAALREGELTFLDNAVDNMSGTVKLGMFGSAGFSGSRA